MILDEDVSGFEAIERLTPREVFAQIWLQPKRVFRFLNAYAFDNYTAILLVLAGISSSLDRAASKNFGDRYPLLTVLGFSILLGGLLGWVSYSIYAWLLKVTGGWLKGKAEKKDILRVVAYAMIPSIVSLLIVFFQILIFGNQIFKSEVDIYVYGTLSEIVFYALVGAEFVLSIWSVVLLVVGISEVQKFTIGKAILNVVLPFFVLIVPVMFLVFLFTIGR